MALCCAGVGHRFLILLLGSFVASPAAVSGASLRRTAGLQVRATVSDPSAQEVLHEAEGLRARASALQQEVAPLAGQLRRLHRTLGSLALNLTWASQGVALAHAATGNGERKIDALENVSATLTAKLEGQASDLAGIEAADVLNVSDSVVQIADRLRHITGNITRLSKGGEVPAQLDEIEADYAAYHASAEAHANVTVSYLLSGYQSDLQHAVGRLNNLTGARLEMHRHGVHCCSPPCGPLRLPRPS